MFLKVPNTSIEVEVIGKRVNDGGGNSRCLSIQRTRKTSEMAHKENKSRLKRA